jgi:hypothetical protein
VLSVAAAASLVIPFVARAAEPIATILTPDQSAFFESKVRPLLSARCYKCHSVEEHKSKGNLTLDTRDGWMAGGKHGAVIVPGEPDKSPLVKAIRYADADLQMPPEGDKLDDAEIAVLEQWVKMGAPDPRKAAAGTAGKLTGLTDKARAHWAFQPVKEPPVPTVKNAAWVKTPVDAFVLAKLEAGKMHPSPPAAREALIRRATFDLIGLPPTPEEVADFVNDSSSDAFATIVERLLASPHYGERWGRHWLDTARYSDTTGAEKNKDEYHYPFAWTYRDYVIAAFNADKPYDVFLKEQIAADLMPDAKDDPSRLAALGFLTVGKRFQNPNDTIDERIDAVSKGTMALTVACARCHDHKFDPIPTADYYSLHGIFASTTEPLEKPTINVAAASGPAYEDYKNQLDTLLNASRKRYYDILESKSTEFRRKTADYLLVATIRGKNRDAAAILLRNKIIADSKLDRDVYGPWLKRVRKGDTVFDPLITMSFIPQADFAAKAPEVLAKLLRPGRRKAALNPLVAKAFENVSPDSLHTIRDVIAVYVKLFADTQDRADAYFEACRNATTADAPTGYDDDLVDLISIAMKIDPAPALTFERLHEIAPQLPVNNQGGFKELRLADIGQLMLTHPGAPGCAMVVADAKNPRNSYVFIRGEQNNRGPVVPRQFLEILSGKDRKPFTQGSGRLQLAEAIASKDNPLTARVAINRIWMQHFGQAFVRTPDDLGVQSEPPSHPELLDYLASQFVKNGWSVKAMHRMIMLSSTYQQSSETNPEYATTDPDNRLLWHANLRRLDFEAVRDEMLQFTGKLDLTLGGKPVNLTEEPYSNRRSVYGYIDRGRVPELMEQFDFADPDMANSRRTSTIVPQQALFFMNSPMAVDVARKVTSRPEFVEARDDAARVAALYEVLYQRKPRPEEVQYAQDFLSSAGAGGLADASGDSAAKQNTSARPLTPKQLKRAEELRIAKQRREAAMARKAQANKRRGGVQNEGQLVARKPLTPWEQYAQALLFTNEIAYVN